MAWKVDGPDPIFPNSDVVSTPQEARDFVHRVKASGVDFVKVYQKLPREEYVAIVDEAKKVGIPFIAHMPWVISAAQASDDGARSIEHFSNVLEGCSRIENEFLTLAILGPQKHEEMFDAFDQQKCERLAEKFARNQTWQFASGTRNTLARSAVGAALAGAKQGVVNVYRVASGSHQLGTRSQSNRSLNRLVVRPNTLQRNSSRNKH